MRFSRAFVALAILGLLATVAHADPETTPKSFDTDCTKISWVQPFTKAKAAAKTQNKLFLVKPVYFGVETNGKW